MKNSKAFLFFNVAVVGLGLLSFLLLFPLSVSAEPNGDKVVTNDSSQRGPTMEEMRKAKAFVKSVLKPNLSSVQPLGRDLPAASVDAVSGTLETQGSASLEAFGEFGVPFTSKRVTHDPPPKDVKLNPNAGAYLSATYPYSAVGKLLFKQDGQWTHCSASLILRSVIVTAAHCIQDFGTGSNTYSNWTFVPAYFSRSAPDSQVFMPYGSWVWKEYLRPATWADGTDTGDGDATNNDMAVILFEKDGESRFIGDQTGWLRYGESHHYFVKSARTGDLWTAALTTLGYPGDSDNGTIMQRCDGPSYLTIVAKALQIYQGSDFTGGSSGGPWVANFGYQKPKYSNGATPGKRSLGNVVVGVTSWGADEPPEHDNYSSRFGKNKEYPDDNYGTFGAGNIAALLNTLCSKKPSGSDKTYQELGYCDKRE